MIAHGSARTCLIAGRRRTITEEFEKTPEGQERFMHVRRQQEPRQTGRNEQQKARLVLQPRCGNHCNRKAEEKRIPKKRTCWDV